MENILPVGTYVTAKGYALIAKLVATGASMEFTRAAVGTGKLPDGMSYDNLTGLVSYKMNAAISSAVKDTDKAVITIQASSENVQEGFLCTEVGVYADDPDEGEIYFGGMDISGDPTYIYANGSSPLVKFAEFEISLLIGSVAKITAVITPGAYASREDVEALQNPEFEDYTEEAEVPSAETALSNIKSGKSFKELWQNIKAFCMGAITLAKISQNGAITEAGKLVLDAIEKNPDIAGTLAYMIKQNQTNISKLNAEFQAGTDNVKRELGKTVYKTVVFPKPFSTPPKVLVTANTDDPTSGIISISSVTNSQFIACIHSQNSDSNMMLYWLAVCK